MTCIVDIVHGCVKRSQDFEQQYTLKQTLPYSTANLTKRFRISQPHYYRYDANYCTTRGEGPMCNRPRPTILYTHHLHSLHANTAVSKP